MLLSHSPCQYTQCVNDLAMQHVKASWLRLQDKALLGEEGGRQGRGRRGGGGAGGRGAGGKRGVGRGGEDDLGRGTTESEQDIVSQVSPLL